ncbi:branched-chain amino acid ABC transporter permease, partial [Comamonas humi]
ALFACAFNLLLGYTGMLSFGHAAFFGGAAYITGHTIKAWGLTPELGILAGVAFGAGLGLVFGWLAIRRQGIYFSMITLALAQMLFFACLQMPFTGGEDGLQAVPRGKLFGVLSLESDLSMYYATLVVVALAFLLIVRTVHSPFGQVLKAIKENEPRAISLGYDVDRFKLLAFVISAALAGLAGSLKTVVLGFATLTDVHWTASGQVILMTLVGGLGTLSGPIVGSAVIVALENKIGDIGTALARATGVEWFSTLGESVTIVTGLIFVVCVLAFRRGVMGEVIAAIQRGRARSNAGGQQ